MNKCVQEQIIGLCSRTNSFKNKCVQEQIVQEQICSRTNAYNIFKNKCVQEQIVQGQIQIICSRTIVFKNKCVQEQIPSWIWNKNVPATSQLAFLRCGTAERPVCQRQLPNPLTQINRGRRNERDSSSGTAGGARRVTAGLGHCSPPWDG